LYCGAVDFALSVRDTMPHEVVHAGGKMGVKNVRAEMREERREKAGSCGAMTNDELLLIAAQP
jgi:hypothetical protein